MWLQELTHLRDGCSIEYLKAKNLDAACGRPRTAADKHQKKKYH